jgi:hypothetical protein
MFIKHYKTNLGGLKLTNLQFLYLTEILIDEIEKILNEVND